MKSKQKLMIMGAGKLQVPIIEQARQMGFETIVVSIPGNYPGFSVADRVYKIDVRKKEEILEIARQEEICGILTDQTDIAIPTIAYVAEQMGLPGIGYDCALRFTNKYMMRQRCEEIDIPVPKYFQVSSLEEAHEKGQKLGFPLMIKPVDSQGSRGVSKINSPEELEEKFQNAQVCSASGFIIIEEFFSGVEVAVEGFVSNFKFWNLVIGDKYYFNIPNRFVPNQTIFPSLLRKDIQKKILDINSRLIKGFGPKFGNTMSEYLANEDTGEVRLVETGIRGDGTFISSNLVPLACGINVNSLLIELASGTKKDITIDQSKLSRRAAGYACFYLPEGVIQRIDGIKEVKNLPGVQKAYLDELEIGMKTKGATDKTMRLGPILIYGKDRATCREIITRIQQTLVIEVKTSEGVKGIEW